MAKEEPLLSCLDSSHGTSSSLQTLGNIIVSIVGTGVLGLPFAFRVAGWLAGSIGVIIAGVSTYYCMTLLVHTRDVLVIEESTELSTYGDLGAKALGKPGRYLTELLILVAHCGGAVAYLLFIGQNLLSVFHSPSGMSYSSFVFLLVPVEIALSFIRSLSALSPFSVFADVCNVLAMAIVVKEDLQLFDGFKNMSAVTSWGGLPFTAGMAVFCFEGFGLTLSLEGAMRERRHFKKVLLGAIVCITAIYVCFGFFGYMAYGEETKDIITLNLPQNWSTVAVKVGLCIALTFTFPIMMHPIHEIVEAKLERSFLFEKICCNSRLAQIFFLNTSRAISVLALAAVASFIPAFGTFVSLVGSTVCALLSFVLPASFHFLLAGAFSPLWQRLLDLVIVLLGLAFAGYGTYSTVSRT
ncbi:amino acid transporter ANT1-like [Aristolochia californica]|uniref:amino acid transporter ANT1-like n=1 Tax=Aristolochia californica TaxID=171875 RepID=UPI0035D9A428